MKTRETMEFLGSLCAIDSRTITGAAGTVSVAVLLGDRLQELGFTLEWLDPDQDTGSRGRHLKAVRNPRAPMRLVLLGHTDTVPSPSEAPFRLDAGSNRVYGAGVCDMKGGCVVLIEALELALAESGPARNAGLVVLLNCSEELPEPSFRVLARNTVKGAVACLGFEPSPLGLGGQHRIVVARKGVTRFELTCYGRAAHAGNDHESGVNAIRELARKIEQIESLTNAANGVTANVGHISGGSVSNQVAEQARALFEVRTFDAEAMQAACEAVTKICSESSVRSVADGTPSRLGLHEHRAYPPWPSIDATGALARRYVKLAAMHGVTPVPVRSGGGADINHVSDLAPALDGLGVMGGAMHSDSEWADTRTLPLRVRIAADLIAELCSDPLLGQVKRR